MWSMLAGAGLGALGGALTDPDKKQITTTTRDPYGPAAGSVDRIVSEADRIYGSQGAYPELDLSQMWQMLNEGGGGGRGGGGGGGAVQQGQQIGRRGGGGGGGGGGAVGRFERLAQDTPGQIGQAFDWAGNVMGGPDLNPYYQQYLDMEDLDTDSEIFQRIRESIGRSTEEDMRRYLDASGAETDTTGMYGSSTNMLERASTRGRFADSLSDAILNAQLGLRGQNIGLMDMIGGRQGEAAGLIPDLERARLMGPEAAAAMHNARRVQGMSNRGALDVARLNAETQRGISGAQLGQRNREWEYAQALGLTGMGFENEMGAYNNPWQQLGMYQGSILPIATGFGTDTQTTVQPGSRMANIFQGALGGMGMGMGMG